MLKSTCNFLVEPDMKIVLGDTKQAFAISLLVGKKKKGGGLEKVSKGQRKTYEIAASIVSQNNNNNDNIFQNYSW